MMQPDAVPLLTAKSPASGKTAGGQFVVMVPPLRTNTSGAYHLEAAIHITRPDSVVLGLGYPTLVPEKGTPAVKRSRMPSPFTPGQSAAAQPPSAAPDPESAVTIRSGAALWSLRSRRSAPA